LESLGDMGFGDRCRVLEIGNGSRDAQGSMVAPGRESEVIHVFLEKCTSDGFDAGRLVQLVRGESGIAGGVRAHSLVRRCGEHARTNFRRTFVRESLPQKCRMRRRQVQIEIDSVEQRTR